LVAFPGAGTLEAVVGALAPPPLEVAVLDDVWGLLDEQPAAASARTATAPTDFIALMRFTEAFLSLVPAQECAQGVG
jgi:hypothetical protein